MAGEAVGEGGCEMSTTAMPTIRASRPLTERQLEKIGEQLIRDFVPYWMRPECAVFVDVDPTCGDDGSAGRIVVRGHQGGVYLFIDLVAPNAIVTLHEVTHFLYANRDKLKVNILNTFPRKQRRAVRQEVVEDTRREYMDVFNTFYPTWRSKREEIVVESVARLYWRNNRTRLLRLFTRRTGR